MSVTIIDEGSAALAGTWFFNSGSSNMWGNTEQYTDLNSSGDTATYTWSGIAAGSTCQVAYHWRSDSGFASNLSWVVLDGGATVGSGTLDLRSAPSGDYPSQTDSFDSISKPFQKLGGSFTPSSTSVHLVLTTAGSAVSEVDAALLDVTAGSSSGAGSAAGGSTASGVGAALASGAGSASGSATASGVGSSLATSAASASGLATASSTGASLSQATASTTGLAAAAGTGSSLALVTANAAGSATAAGVSGGTSSGTGSADGAATAAGIGTSQSLVAASAAGVSIAAGTGSSLATATVTATATATATGVPGGVASGAGSAAGTSTAAATGVTVFRVTASAAGLATAAGASSWGAKATAAGTATTAGIGLWTVLARATGTSTATGRGVGGAPAPGRSGVSTTGLGFRTTASAVLAPTLGRYRLGDVVALTLATVDDLGVAVIPDAAPVATLTGPTLATIVLTLALDPGVSDHAHFALPFRIPIGSAWGRYTVTYTYSWAEGGGTGTAHAVFDAIAGGDPGGAVVSMAYIDRPEARYVVAQLASGRLVQGRNPHL